MLPDPVTVDFVTLRDASQVLNFVNVPPGFYSAAVATLDFSSASAYVVGETVEAAITDSDGNPLTGLVDIPVVAGNLTAIARRNRILELDFDLNQSVMVDVPSNTVSVEPTLVMRVDRTDPKDFVLGGSLGAVDTAASTFVLDVETLAREPVTTLTVQVAAAAVYQVDGVPATGSAGLAALAALPPGTWVQCYGAVDPLQARFHAVYVEAGTGTYNGGSDIVEGHVVGRVGAAGADATLTVLGHSNDATHTSFLFNETFTVDVAFADTKVLRRGMVDACDTGDINVGQRVRVFGTLTGTMLDATAPDAVVRMQPTRVLGFANAMPANGTLDLELERVDLRPEGDFFWSEGGTTPPDPDSMQLAIAGLAAGLGIDAGTAVEARGHFTAVDDGPEDFVVTSLTNRSTAPSLVLIHDRASGLVVTPAVDTGAISFAISGAEVAGEVAGLDQGFVGWTDLPTTPDFSAVPAGAIGLYAIRDRQTGAVGVHLAFDAFANELNAFLGLGAAIYNFGAVGQYDVTANAMSAFLVFVVVE